MAKVHEIDCSIMLSKTDKIPYQQHIQSAINTLRSEIEELEKAGLRCGCLVESPTARGKYKQVHWCHGKQRTYVKKALVSKYQAEINRFKQVVELGQKIELLTKAL